MKKVEKRPVSAAILVAAFVVAAAASWTHVAIAQAPAGPPPASEQPAAQPPAAEQPAAAPASPLIAPAITGPLAIQLPPTKFAVGPLGDIYLNGIGSGLFQWQNNVVPNIIPGNRAAAANLSNGQLFLQKTDGLIQFYVQGGAYSVPDLGLPYVNAALATSGSNSPFGNMWGWFPQGFVKIAPTENFSIIGGKLPTLIGAEYTFSFENINIQRGLLWNQENAVNKGVQANYNIGPVALSLAFSDGFKNGGVELDYRLRRLHIGHLQHVYVCRRRQCWKDQYQYSQNPVVAEQLADLQSDLHLQLRPVDHPALLSG